MQNKEVKYKMQNWADDFFRVRAVQWGTETPQIYRVYGLGLGYLMSISCEEYLTPISCVTEYYLQKKKNEKQFSVVYLPATK